jgi:hypothetical protein
LSKERVLSHGGRFLSYVLLEQHKFGVTVISTRVHDWLNIGSYDNPQNIYTLNYMGVWPDKYLE